jgi:RimJ/RimL family protein N-acetyltransferase
VQHTNTLQPVLESNLIRLQPLQETDFEALYTVASDPLIWEQHPNKNRYQRDVFKTYFEGAMESKGALLVLEKGTGEIVGCSRFYDFTPESKSILIGYTFIARKFWGRSYNRSMKELMMNHAFQFVDTILFHIGANNIRSQKAIERIGATKQRELAVAYHGEPEKLNFEYVITKQIWQKHRS